MSEQTDRRPMRRVGALWKPRPGAKSKGSGSMTIRGWRQKFVIVVNDRKERDNHPDYVLLAGDEPERDDYERREPAPTSSRPAASSRPSEPAPFEATGDDIPF